MAEERTIQIQDDDGNVYCPQTKAAAVFLVNGSSVETQMAGKVNQTTEDITYYVATTGDDIMGDGSQTKPFKTIQHAIDLLPQVINHSVKINVADGIYNESLEWDGSFGKSVFTLTGNTTTPANVIVKNIKLNSCLARTNIFGFTVNPDNGVNALYINNATKITIDNIISTNANSAEGILTFNANIAISNSTMSNKLTGIKATYSSIVYSQDNHGTGNTIGLSSESASKIGKCGTQPGGTTAEQTLNGGTIS